MQLTNRFSSLLILASLAICSPVATPTEPDLSLAVSVKLNGQTFVNKVLTLVRFDFHDERTRFRV